MRFSENMQIVGNMDFGLNGKGESLHLFDRQNNLIDWVSYGVSAPWPDSADTKDRSIVLIDPEADNSLAENWRLSKFVEGNPGEHDYDLFVSSGLHANIYSQGLKQNYPNPFNLHTTIDYEVNHSTTVILKIINLNGQLVRTLVNHYHSPGQYSYSWDGKSANGEEVNAQVFFCQMITSSQVETIKMIKTK